MLIVKSEAGAVDGQRQEGQGAELGVAAALLADAQTRLSVVRRRRDLERERLPVARGGDALDALLAAVGAKIDGHGDARALGHAGDGLEAETARDVVQRGGQRDFVAYHADAVIVFVPGRDALGAPGLDGPAADAVAAPQTEGAV